METKDMSTLELLKSITARVVKDEKGNDVIKYSNKSFGLLANTLAELGEDSITDQLDIAIINASLANMRYRDEMEKLANTVDNVLKEVQENKELMDKLKDAATSYNGDYITFEDDNGNQINLKYTS